jgi:monoamine oxidase
LRPLAAQIAEDAARLERDFDRFGPPLNALSVTAYLDQHADTIPVPFIRTLVENSIRTEYGVEPEASSALQFIFNLPTVQDDQVEVMGSSDEIFVVEGGSGQLIQALAQALAGQIQTRMALQRVEAVGSGFRLGFATGQVVDADVVILAIPVTVLWEVDLQVSLPPRLRRFISSRASSLAPRTRRRNRWCGPTGRRATGPAAATPVSSPASSPGLGTDSGLSRMTRRNAKRSMSATWALPGST